MKNIEFYKELAKEIKKDGYRSFLYSKDYSAWLYIITPSNSWLYVGKNCYSGFDVTYEYVPSRDFGSGCAYNSDPLYEITTETLKKAEQYGKGYGHKGWIKVPNTYDGKSHRETVWRSPKHYENGYKAMIESYFGKDLVEL